MISLRQRVLRSITNERSFVDWTTVASKLTDPSARAALESLRNTYGQIKAEANVYVKEPEEIDFNHYRSIIRNKALVDAMEENYKSIQYPEITPEDLETSSPDLPEQFQFDEGKLLQDMDNELNEQVKDSKHRITELRELITLLNESKVTKDTTMDEMTAMYPEIHEEIDEEIANMEWDKDLS